MRLKSLDIKGFKSFADKTQVLLDHPITGVVGPNGCGKSNIVDAIRWVIGEHKIKSLRSDNLEDLIFNGSRTRARSGMAEVSLTFENTRNLLPTEFTTVTITRRFYKNGESEYRLNDVTCRLKDIHNLFLDTGVSNDSYAIIELGMVDDIIKDKDGARRRMLEQAAGVSIYKTRKKEAKQKLEGTEGDLSRIEDLLFEIGNNLRTLESQARKAERYVQIKGDYKAASIELAKSSLEHFNAQYKTLNAQSAAETDRKTALEAALATEEAQLQKDKLRLTEREVELNGLQKAFNELLARTSAAESDKKLAGQKLEHLQEREGQLEQALIRAGEQLEMLQNAIGTAAEQEVKEAEHLHQLREALEGLRTELDRRRATFDEKRKAAQAALAEQASVQRGGFEAEKKAALAEATIANLQRSTGSLREEAAQRGESITRLRTEQQTAVTGAQTAQKNLEGLLQKQEETKALILAGQEKLEGHRARLVEETRTLDARKAEHDLLKSLVDSLEGYPDSIKFLARNKDWPGDAPLLSDIFGVQPQYRKALEAVLEPYLNYYVVQNAAQGMAGIQLLQQHKKGKAHFFLLNQMRSGSEAEAVLPAGLPAGSVAALEVIEVEYQYAAVVTQLLQNVFICPDENFPPQSAAAGYTLVAQSGVLRATPFSVSGGSAGAFEGAKIGRAKNLEALAGELVQRGKTVADVRAALAQAQVEITGHQAALADRAIAEAQREVTKLQSAASNAAARAEQLEQLGLASAGRLADLEEQLQRADTAAQTAAGELAKVRQTLESLEARTAAVAEEAAGVEKAYNEASAAYNAHNIKIYQQQSKVDQLRQEGGFRMTQLASLEEEIAQNGETQKRNRAQVLETEALIAQTEDSLYTMLRQRGQDEAALNEKDRQYYELRNAVAAAETALSQKRRELSAADTLLLQVREKLTEMKLELAGTKERLQVSFGVDLDAILEEARTTDFSREELQAEADRLKKRLEALGDVNPTAIEAYTEMKSRHDFIAEQKGDLEAARNSLLATIEEVEATANQKFKETFDAVRENFVTVFKALFTEDDNADLRLTDEGNLAESTIEIYAQPKGKRPSTLTQLSGGEKTLTSTAFLFAIYLIKPAPFCILDEVDAPLDDANVGKFTNMIRKFSDNSQFIIVTHNKQTMAAVDVIYGVTMQEPGVSKLVPVDFRSLS